MCFDFHVWGELFVLLDVGDGSEEEEAFEVTLTIVSPNETVIIENLRWSSTLKTGLKQNKSNQYKVLSELRNVLV